jgi:hypothetical protein
MGSNNFVLPLAIPNEQRGTRLYQSVFLLSIFRRYLILNEAW